MRINGPTNQSWWKVTYLDCFGAMTIIEREEYFLARSKRDAHRKFLNKYGDDGPRTGYQRNFTWDVMKDDIIQVDGPPN